jgi:bifunctional UDP-N-acetylglucosamine pyrophosphorylase/glucosamine-1-phosphate N-acetyltransferase
MHRSPRSCLDTPPTSAVVLAAGRGRRLIPHTNHRPKPLLETSGRPILAYTLDALAVAGVKEVCLVIGYLGQQIEAYLEEANQWPFAVTFRRQEQRLGTAHALSVAVDFLSAPTFIVAADYILPAGYLVQLKQAYCAAQTPLAVSLKRLEHEQLAQRSSVAFGPDGQIMRIEEKPDPANAPSNLGASLIYIVPPQISEYLHRVPLSQRGEYEIVDVINHMIADGMAITGLEQQPPPEWQPPE